jgi:hypothetical protein
MTSRQACLVKTLHQYLSLHCAHFARLDYDRTSRGDRRRHLNGDRSGARIPRRKDSDNTQRLKPDLRASHGRDEFEVSEDVLKVQEYARGEIVGALGALLGRAVFQDRRPNKCVHAFGHGIMQPLQVLHSLVSAGLRKRLEGLLRRGNGPTRVTPVRHRHLADHLIVGRISQVDYFPAMGCYELAVDIGLVERPGHGNGVHRSSPALRRYGRTFALTPVPNSVGRLGPRHWASSAGT